MLVHRIAGEGPLGQALPRDAAGGQPAPVGGGHGVEGTAGWLESMNLKAISGQLSADEEAVLQRSAERGPDRPPITADEYLQERLREIKLV